MKKEIFNTNDDWSSFVIRLTIGLIIFPHGAQKMLGWFGGPGFSGEMNFLTTVVNLPWIIAFLVIFIEFVGALSLIAGFASRIWAVLMISLMIGIIVIVHFDNGFFMNWFGNQKGEGYEYHLLVIGLSLAILFGGSGKFSVDSVIVKK
ncbi:hypothetical protein WSM22_05900 [Cytophagales bacterium WSM2-2]|nr:hypothetical protein WSM22_05900 [Cytophagales bacterium WSM2-2]